MISSPEKAPGAGEQTGRKLTAKPKYHRTAFTATSDRKRGVEPILANASVENALLGSLIVGGRPLIDNLGVSEIDPNLFYYSQSRIILGVIAELYDEGAPIDLQIITQRLQEHCSLESAGGVSAITVLGTDGNGDSDVARFYLDELRGLYAKRQAARIADRMKSGDIDLADAKATLDEIIESTQAQKSWRGALNESVITSSQLRELQLTPRKKLLGDWFCEGDLAELVVVPTPVSASKSNNGVTFPV
jgi:DnaB-like helicase N terminal domain